ncbi:hypothetical protein C8J57DRAFT_1054853 [Mycena rebaudengoi]|nr:hypothetical protein C8J57DRAFT_1054853 [Mycena rebaudengoi]
MYFALALIFMGLWTSCYAQFQFFQQQQQPPPPSAAQWAAHLESVSCSQYLCPATLDCVDSPIRCPCPHAEDVKCIIPDADEAEGTVVCVRGQSECEQVERLTRSSGRKK